MGGVNCTNCNCNNEEGNEMNGLTDKKIRKISMNMRSQSYE